MSDKTEQKKELKIAHLPAPDFSSHIVTGSILSSSSSDGLFHIIFFADAVKVDYETAYSVEGGEPDVYRLDMDQGSLTQFREDKCRLSMSLDSLIRLRDVIDTHLKRKNIEVPATPESEIQGGTIQL